jgi:selenide,water dikinase
MAEISSTYLYKYCKSGGCAAKLNPSDLKKIVAALPRREHPDLLGDFSGNEDAAVYRLDADSALVATVDVIAPPVGEPVTFGRIAAANAVSDIYAMGARPLLCLGIFMVPEDLPIAEASAILRGADEVIAESGAFLGGGHTVVGSQLFFGLAVFGRARTEQLWRNGGARHGDALVLTKPIGMGVLFSAFRRGKLPPDGVADAVRWAATLNARAAEVLAHFPVHAATDVTGFGLVGHALEIARASGVMCTIRTRDVPILDMAIEMYERDLETSITAHNISYAKEELLMCSSTPEALLQVLHDPQTNGGLLASVPVEVAPAVVSGLRAAGLERAAIIGSIDAPGTKSLVLQ